ncbi:MAG TPA: TolC family protein [Gemmatimonadaceae bacterium]|jgi:outer membrane protein
MQFSKLVAAALFAAIPALSSRAAHAQTTDSTSSPVLSIEQAVTLAVRHNPTHLSVVNDRSGATALRKEAYGQLLPRLDAQLTGFYQKAGAAPLNSVQFATSSDVYQSFYNLGLTYNLSLSSLVMPKRQNANVRAAEADIVGSQINVQTTVTQDYLTVLQDQAKVILQDTLIAQAQLQLDLAKAKVAVGSGTELDVSKAQVTLGQAQVAAIQARNLVDVDKLRLFQEMGVPEPQNVQLTSQFVVEPPKFTLDSVLGLARLQNPTLNALKVRTQVASIDVTSARSSYFPSLTVQTGISGFTDQFANPDVLIGQAAQSAAGCFSEDSLRVRTGLPSLGCQTVTPEVAAEIRKENSQFPFSFTRQPLQLTATLSLPIFNNFQREQQVEQAEATRNDADYRAKAQELQLTADVTAAYLTLQAQVQTVTLQEQNAAQARQQLDLAEVKYKAGAATYLDISDAQATFSTAENDRINAIYQYHKAFAALEGAVGHPLR